MNKKLYYISAVLLIVVLAFSCNFQPKIQKTQTSISFPASFLRSVVDLNRAATHYIKYELSGAKVDSGKKEITIADIESNKNISLTLKEIPTGENLHIIIKITEDLNNNEKVLYRGEKTTSLNGVNNSIDIDLEEVLDETPVTPTVSVYQVGDLILKNGDVIRYSADSTFTDEQKANAVAVIFRASTADKPALGVGVKQSRGSWARSGTIGYTTGWYLPSLAEFVELENNLAIVNDVLVEFSGKEPNQDGETHFKTEYQEIDIEWYWTSSLSNNSANPYYAFSEIQDDTYVFYNGTYQRTYANCYLLAIRQF